MFMYACMFTNVCRKEKREERVRKKVCQKEL